MDIAYRRTSVISLLAILGAVVGGAFGRWAAGAGLAVSSVSWGFSVVLLPVAIVAGIALGGRDRAVSARLSATAQAAMTLAFAVFALTLRSRVTELARIPWQILVVLFGDVVVTTAGLALAAWGATLALLALARPAPA